MSLSYIPAWAFCIPERNDPKYLDYLLDSAPKDGVPNHVRLHLIRSYYVRTLLPSPDGLSLVDDQICLSYNDDVIRNRVYGNLEEMFNKP